MSSALPGDNAMKIYEIRNKIVEVWAAARIIVQRYGHTKKFAKHFVAFALKQMLHFTDNELAEFLGKDEIGRELGYAKAPHISTFSKVRKRSDIRIMQELTDWLVINHFKGKQISLIAQDSTDISAYAHKDKSARYGHRTPSKKEQRTLKEFTKTLFFGFKVHMIAEVNEEVPLCFSVEPANIHDKKLFTGLFANVKEKFVLQYMAKYLADSAYDSTDIKMELRNSNAAQVISTSSRGHFKSEVPKDKDYEKRWAIERIFSRLKEVFGLAKNRFVGIKNIAMHVHACILAYMIKYVL